MGADDENTDDLTTFKVIGVTGNEDVKIGVQVEGMDDIYLLEPASFEPILHTGSAPAFKSYHYVMRHNNGTVIDQETFFRPPSTASLHEFYGRELTVGHHNELSTLPQLFTNTPRVNRLDNSVMHPRDEIPTIHIRTSAEDVKGLYDNYLEDYGILVSMSHISSSDILSFDNVKFQLGGQTSRLFEKLSFNVHITKASQYSLGGYRRFKLRSAATDPSFMREKMYYDILDAAGLPASHASFVRLFINEEPMGLYVVIDNYKSPFLKNVFGHGEKYKHGVLYQGDMPENPMASGVLTTGANLAYLGPNPSDYMNGDSSLYKIHQEASKKDNGLKRLIKFMAFVHNPKADDERTTLEEAWTRRLNVPLFLKNIAFEVLMGQVDGYLGAAHNYFLYYEPKLKQFQWMSADLDQTMGNTMIPLRTTPFTSSDPVDVLDRFDLLNNKKDRPLLQQILKVPAFKAQFHSILKDIHAALYANSTLVSHLEGLKKFIKDDAVWDAQVRRIRSSALADDEVVLKHRDQIQQKILQLPLGNDFLGRIGSIEFDSAVDGPIENHPSLIPLRHWLVQTNESLNRFIAASAEEDVFKANSEQTEADEEDETGVDEEAASTDEELIGGNDDEKVDSFDEESQE